MSSTPTTFALALALATTGCGLLQGPEGPEGAQGDQGQAGAACWDLNANGEADPDSEDLNGDGVVDVYDCQGLASDGEDGEDGEDWSPPSLVGAAACADCHEAQYQTWLRSGHAHALVATGGAAPSEPWGELGSFGSYAPEPPPGLAWSDISHVVGGWSRLQAFADADGWTLSGSNAAWDTQRETWLAWEAEHDPGTVTFDCGRCHATGYRPEGSQDGLPGIQGTWAEAGVACERCHGSGSQHVMAPYDVPMTIDRSAELCGECHVRESTDAIQARDGFLMDGQQWTELFHGKKHIMDCSDCHDPHGSAFYTDSIHNPGRGIQVPCESCHFQQSAQQGSSVMAGYVGCTGCHMADAVVVAQAENSAMGDHPSHLFAINLDLDAAQVEGDEANPWLSFEMACRGCHSDEGPWMNYSDEELMAEAQGYHD